MPRVLTPPFPLGRGGVGGDFSVSYSWADEIQFDASFPTSSPVVLGALDAPQIYPVSSGVSIDHHISRISVTSPTNLHITASYFAGNIVHSWALAPSAGTFLDVGVALFDVSGTLTTCYVIWPLHLSQTGPNNTLHGGPTFHGGFVTSGSGFNLDGTWSAVPVGIYDVRVFYSADPFVVANPSIIEFIGTLTATIDAPVLLDAPRTSDYVR